MFRLAMLATSRGPGFGGNVPTMSRESGLLGVLCRCGPFQFLGTAVANAAEHVQCPAATRSCMGVA